MEALIAMWFLSVTARKINTSSGRPISSREVFQFWRPSYTRGKPGYKYCTGICFGRATKVVSKICQNPDDKFETSAVRKGIKPITFR
jgi:hypothetical protein